MATNAQMIEALWGMGYDEAQLRAIPTTGSQRDFTLALIDKYGIKSEDATRAAKAADWRVDKGASSDKQIASYLHDVAGISDTNGIYAEAKRLAGGREPQQVDMMKAAKEVLSPQAFTQMTIKTGVPQLLTSPGFEGTPAWNPFRGDAPPAPPPGFSPAEVAARTAPAPGPAPAPAPKPAAAAAPRATAAPTAARGAPTPAAAADTTPKLAPNANQADTLAFIREHYGYGAWIFDHPDVAKVLTDAAHDGHWSDARLQGALGATDFFKQNTGTTVSWMNTETNDPATAKFEVDQKVNEVTAKAQTIGMDLDPGRAREIATDAKRFGWDDTQLTQAVGHEYHYNPTMAQKGIAKQITDTARLYGIPMTDSGLDEWGRKVASGDASADDFKVTMINQAKSLFPTLAADLDRGATVKDIFDPYAKLAATTLGVDASTIDILDPKWQRPLQSSDGKNPTRMSTYDWTKTLRTDATYGWDTTDNARQEAAGFAHQIRQSFGLA